MTAIPDDVLAQLEAETRRLEEEHNARKAERLENLNGGRSSAWEPPAPGSSRKEQQPVTLTDDQKLAGLEVAAADLLARKVPYTMRLPLLRASGERMGITVRDQELQALLTAARRARVHGDSRSVLQPGDRLDLTPEPWAWDSVVLRGAFNLWVALPKVGKTSLALASLNAWYRHEPAFLDRTLIGPCPPVLIVGTDQGQADWGRMLQEIGWVDAAGTIGGSPMPGCRCTWIPRG